MPTGETKLRGRSAAQHILRKAFSHSRRTCVLEMEETTSPRNSNNIIIPQAVDPRLPPKSTQQVPPWAHLLAGASGGLATAILTSPLDVLRTRLQSDIYQSTRPVHREAVPFKPTHTHLISASMRHLRETAQIVNSIYYTEGWRAFFRGLGPSLAGVVPATAIKFYIYGNCKALGARVLGYREDSTIVHAQAAIFAGIATATATNPIWVVKTRLQLDHSRTKGGVVTGRRYKNSLDCVTKILRHEGVSGLYRGLTASYLGTVETALHLVLYEHLKRLFRKSMGGHTLQNSTSRAEFIDWVSTSGAAGSAKLAAVILAYPHEVVKTRLRQAPTESGQPKYTGLWQCFRSIWLREGVVGLYGGLTPHMVRSVPSAVITFGVYEFVLRLVRA